MLQTTGLSEDAQEALELLWISNKERPQDASPLNDTVVPINDTTLLELESNGLVAQRDGRIDLTEKGWPEAESAVRRHRLAERLMVDVLDTADATMDESACRFEHLLHRELEQKVCTLLGHPRLCPHGRPIPAGECCRRSDKGETKLVAAMSTLKAGQSGIIAYLNTQEQQELQKMMSMGILPGMPIEVQQVFPSYVFRINNSQFAIDKELAGRIFIRLAR